MSEQKTIESFFQDPNSSSVVSIKAQQITAPTCKGSDLMPEELMQSGGMLRVEELNIDGSYSMEKVIAQIRDGLNKDFRDAVAEAREDDIAALRFGGLVFDDYIKPIWEENGEYFHTLENLPLLTDKNYQVGGCTNLHGAIIEGQTRAIKFAATQKAQFGIDPDVDNITISDGYDNINAHSADEVRQMIQGSRKDRVRNIFFFYDTAGIGMDQDNPNHPFQQALALGYDPEMIQIFEQKPGETEKEHKARFRRMMRVLSKISAAKGTSAVQAGAAVAAAEEDDEDYL